MLNCAWNFQGYMDYLYDQPLNKFEFGEDITEEQFLNGVFLELIDKQQFWFISIDMLEDGLIKMRKRKLDGLDHKI
jgi:hypothetical protein